MLKFILLFASIACIRDETAEFADFRLKYAKIYTSEEELKYRFDVFKQNLKLIAGDDADEVLTNSKGQPLLGAGTDEEVVVRKKAPKAYTVEINQFADFTDEEFSRFYLLPPEVFKSQRIISKAQRKRKMGLKGKISAFILGSSLDDIPGLDSIAEPVVPKPKLPMALLGAPLDDIPGIDSLPMPPTGPVVPLPPIEPAAPATPAVPAAPATPAEPAAPATPAAPVVPKADQGDLTPSEIKQIEKEVKEVVKEAQKEEKKEVPKEEPVKEKQPEETHEEKHGRLLQTLARLPRKVDWKKYASRIKNQNRCSSCYAFAAIGVLEIAQARKANVPISLSEQEILDCSQENQGCSGGQPFLVFDYILEKSLSPDNLYQYTGRAGQCKNIQLKQKYRGLKDYRFIDEDIISLLAEIAKGPAAVVHQATNRLKFYKQGVFTGEECGPNTPLNHSATAVGYDLDAQIPYILFKNAWGGDWGEAGYYKLAIGPLNPTSQGICMSAATPFNAVPIL